MTTRNTAPEVDVILTEDYEAPRGLLHVDAVGILAQLDKEVVHEYEATEKATNTIVTELMALQENPNPLTVGTIDYTDDRSIIIPEDTILGALRRLQESVGGYIYVDSAGALQWRTSVGSDTGQQLRFGKNIMQIRRSVDYTDLANRLWAWGAGEGVDLIRLGKGMVSVQPQASADMFMTYYDTNDSEWKFKFGYSGAYYFYAGWRATTNRAYGGAFRFPDVAVPQGATILKAELRLTARSSAGDDCNTRIYAEDADDSAQFTTWANYNNRPGTTEIDWDDIDSWTIGQVYAKAITSSVQAVVDRVGWESGNAMCIFWEDHDNRSTIYHYRSTYLTYAISQSPLLYIEYTLPAAVDYLEDEASQALYGFSAASMTDVAITDSATLFEWATRMLSEMSSPNVSYQAMIADLEQYGFSFDGLSLGNLVRVMDEGISLDVSTRITRLVRSLTDRMNVGVELANREKTILDKMDFAKDPRWRQHYY